MTAPGCEVVLKGVRTLTDWDLSTQTLTADTIGQLFPEGGGPAPYTNGKVRLLLGLPQAHLVCATECRENLDAGRQHKVRVDNLRRRCPRSADFGI